MADFNSKPTPKMEAGAGLVLDNAKLPQLQIDLGRREGDFLSSLGDAAARAKPRAEAAVAGLVLDAFDLDLGLAGFGLETPQQRRLRDAKERISAGQFREALAILAQVLKETPDHAEAAYLAGCCHARLGKPREALAALRPLGGADVPNRLATRVRALRAEVREQIEPGVVAECTKALQAGQVEQAVCRLREVVDLDPECGIYHYLLAGSLLMAQRPGEAVEAVRVGLERGDPEFHDRLRGLQREAQLGLARQLMGPARTCWRQGKYAKARSALHALDAACKALPLWQIFDRFLGQAQGGLLGMLGLGGRPGAGTPPGTVPEMDLLYGFLLEDELFNARVMVQTGRLAEAEVLLTGAVKLAPHYPFAHFLLALALYYQLGERLVSGRPPSLDELVGGLERARDHARVATTDASFPDAARLRATLEQLLGQFAALREEVAQRERDAKVFNQAATEYQAVMTLVGNGIRSPQHYRQVHDRLKALRDRLPAVRHQLRSQEGLAAMGQLESLVQENFRQLEGLRDQVEESEQVGALATRFTTRMEKLKKSPIKSHAELDENRRFFRGLRSDAESLRGRVRDPQAREALGNMIQVVNDILTQLQG